ncbi:MAG: ribosome biogenesis GTPase Der [Candidatus Omnitrophica bacterium]|nr:ribosome biogenesis GTPase Der [Candidatus Omnitrophota bacterium]
MTSYIDIPVVSIVGRPNVGKSSLFNRLLGERKAVVVEQSGTTRDRVEAVVSLSGKRFKLVDTGGYLSSDTDGISAEVREQAKDSMEGSDILLFTVDASEGISPADEDVSSVLRRTGKPVIVVANKTDNDRLRNDAMEFYSLGFGDPVPVSCLHGRGMNPLRERLSEALPETAGKSPRTSRKTLKIAVVGRPNVGKSSFVNRLLDQRRVIVSDMPGTTRDSIDTYFSYEDKDYILIDTAGIRHRRKIKTAVDTYSIMRSKESILRSDIAVLLIDASDGFTRDDSGILKFISDSGKGCLIAVNKWDLAREAGAEVTADEYRKHLLYASSQVGKFPILFISAQTGRNVLQVLSMAEVVDSNLELKISTSRLNRIFERNDPEEVPIPKRKRRPNFLYIIQSGRKPMEFKYFVNRPSSVLPAHLSFIENQLRENLPLKGIPVRISIHRSRKDKK